ncbi:MAG: hypothetical protein Q8K85_05425 [Hyphomicrobium sp.]|nr:hypothetical protein [Hyphomicrobium sp.]
MVPGDMQVMVDPLRKQSADADAHVNASVAPANMATPKRCNAVFTRDESPPPITPTLNFQPR